MCARIAYVSRTWRQPSGQRSAHHCARAEKFRNDAYVVTGALALSWLEVVLQHCHGTWTSCAFVQVTSAKLLDSESDTRIALAKLDTSRCCCTCAAMCLFQTTVAMNAVQRLERTISSKQTGLHLWRQVNMLMGKN